MNFTTKLRGAWAKNNSLLCVGLDPVVEKMPEHIKNSDAPLFEFSKAIVDATADVAAAFKPNSAFFEAQGADGITQLKRLLDYISSVYPDVVTILDAKRADIGNTNNGYIEFAYEYLQADSITLHPYLGREALAPFLDRSDKGAIILCRTSNTGAGELQDLQLNNQPLYEYVAESVANSWNTNGNCMLVVGATYPGEMESIRRLAPDVPFLVPGIGAQGGDLAAAMSAGLDTRGEGLLISASRSIIYASSDTDFSDAARAEAVKLRDEINSHRSN